MIEKISTNMTPYALPADIAHYAADGNQIMIFAFQADTSRIFDPRHDKKLRHYLSHVGKIINTDSIMLLAGNPLQYEQQGYHVQMDVFEPAGDHNPNFEGGFSTMCGNGILAVGAYLQEKYGTTLFRIKTRSGIRTIHVQPSGYTVNMGKLTTAWRDLAPYITDKVIPNPSGEFYMSAIPREIQKALYPILPIDKWNIGLAGDRTTTGYTDGEPHVVILIPSKMASNLTQLREVARKAGPLITKNEKFFPNEINVNFVVLEQAYSNKISALIATHERNLGSDPFHSVTASCGTGATVTGGLLLFEKSSKTDTTIVLKSRGGSRVISQNQSGETIMKGWVTREYNLLSDILFRYTDMDTIFGTKDATDGVFTWVNDWKNQTVQQYMTVTSD